MSGRILLSVDDSSDDLMLLRLACGAAKVGFQLQTVDGGESAMAYLEGTQQYADRTRFPLPNLMLLDLKMPGKSGFDVLAWIRTPGRFEHLPIVVFTSSVHAEDRSRALQLGANGFVVKPIGYDALQRFVNAVDLLLSSEAQPDFTVLEDISDSKPVPSGRNYSD